MSARLRAAGWVQLSANVWTLRGYTLLTSSGVCISPIGKRKVLVTL